MKKTLLLAAFAAFVSGAFAQTTYSGTTTSDSWIRTDNTGACQGGNAIEMKTYSEGATFYGLMSFEFTNPSSGNEVKSAILRTTTRYKKGDSELKVYGIDYVNAESTNYGNMQTAIEAAVAGTPLATFRVNGDRNNAPTDGGLNADYQTIEAWQNTLDLTSYVRSLSTNKFTLLFVKTYDQNNSTQIYSREATGLKWNSAINEGADIADADVQPLLTVEYQEATETATEALSAAVDGWVTNGASSYTGAEIELKNQVYTEEETEKTDLFYGVLHFNIPAAPAGKELTSASLRLVSERVKNDRTTNVYFTDQEINDGDTYTTLETTINGLTGTTPTATFEMKGNNNSVKWDGQSTANSDIAAWTNDITLPIDQLTGKTTLNIILTAPDSRDSKNDSNRFFSSEATGFTNTNSNNESGDFTVATADILPQLTLKYVTPTGIETVTVKADPVAKKGIYNLAGQRVENPTKGIYIIDGKKVVVK